MFIDILKKRNPSFIQDVFSLHAKGELEPDTYVIDLDTFTFNAEKILEEANKKNIKLYFMLKQVGRNPYLAKLLMKLGYAGAVVVDHKEALVMMKHGIPLGNTGHLVQIPKHQVEKIVEYGSEVITVYSFEKLEEINNAAQKYNKVQDILVKVAKDDDLFYSGQISGIKIEELPEFITKAKNLKNVSIVGATAFPCYLFNPQTEGMEKTPNYDTVIQATEIMSELGCTIKQINVPSTTSVATLEKMEANELLAGEPGHGLSGTTPAHISETQVEIPAVCYLSEVSHQYADKSYCYAGGHYRRSHMENAMVLVNDKEVITKVIPTDLDSIDYYFELQGLYPVSAPVIMAFRFQMFVTRSKVALIKKDKNGNAEVVGIYDGLGNEYE